MFIGLDEEKIHSSCPKDLEPYVKAHKNSLREKNELSWVQGKYIHDAFAVVLGNAFSKTSTGEYPKEPYALYGAKSRVDEEANERLASLEFMAYAKALEREGRMIN